MPSLLITLLTPCLFVFTAITQAQDIDPAYFYRLTTAWQGEGKSLDIISDASTNKPILAPSGNTAGQNWKLTPFGNGFHRLSTQGQGEGKSLDIINDGQNNKPILAPSGNYSGQMWKLTKLAPVASAVQAIPAGQIPIVITEETTITANPTNAPLIITPKPNSPIVVGSCKDSIFNTKNCNLLTGPFESAVRQQTGLTDKNQLRAAVYAQLIQIAKTQKRTREEQALMDWLALQVKETRIEAARLALAEYDRWQRDPWSYEPPAGYDFPAYAIPHPKSHIWYTTTPNPPVLANQSWQTFLSGIVSNNGWSPLNNPMLNKGQKKSSLENVVGFPVFGTVLAYQKLYGTVEGVRPFAETSASLSTQPFNLPPVGAAIASPGNIATARMVSLEVMAPYSHRVLNATAELLKARMAGTESVVPLPKLAPGETRDILDVIKATPDGKLRTAMRSITSGHAIASFVVSFVLSSAIQEIISESMMLDTKIKLRGKLVENLEKQRSAPQPNLGNLLYWDIQGVIALYGADYQPTDPVELERMMGSQEVYSAFLLSTIE